MSVLYHGFEPELKFFGTMNGSSRSHTNAFFCPDDETLVLIDMSLLNSSRACEVIRNMPNLRQFYACVTHTHDDHCTGLGEVAFLVKSKHPLELLTVLTDRAVSDDVAMRLDSCGMRPYHTSVGNEDEVYQLISYDEYGGAYAFYDKHGHTLKKKTKPNWFVRSLVTSHSPRLKSCGFVFRSHGKLIVYTGDTNDLIPYMGYLRVATDGHTDHDDPPIEFYLDVATRKSELHLCFAEIADELRVMLDEYPTLNLILMHYDDVALLAQQVNEKLPQMLNERVFIARVF